MKQLRKILFPFAGLYYIITLLRNKAYDLGYFSHKEYDVPIICIGNLNTGGTGKSPMTEYLIRCLKGQYPIATLSRGYGRKTKGYLQVFSSSVAQDVGDEPLQFARKFDDIIVSVCEDRQFGILQLMKIKPAPEVLILDDAYQHRKVKAGFQIVLTAYHDLYIDDYLLPVGNLREPRNGVDRAKVIIVTKCPADISQEDRELVINKLKLSSSQSVYFTTIRYSDMIVSNDDKWAVSELKGKKITLVTGIANPIPLVKHLQSLGVNFQHKAFRDHHNFALSEIKELESCEFILTTEKDYVRLAPLLNNTPLYYLAIEVSFVVDETLFREQVFSFVNDFN